MHHFDLITHLVKRNFTLRYKGSVIGILWSLILPLCQLIVLVFVFGKVVPLNIEDYPIFIFTALLPWIWFSTCLNSAGNLFTENRDLIRRPNFSPSILVVVDTIANLLPYLIFMPVLFVMLQVYSRPLTSSLIYLPLLIVVQGVLIAGLGLIVATLNVFYRDVRYVVSVVVMLLFYITPVFYRTQMIAESYPMILMLNPLAGLIDGYRAVLFYGSSPELATLLPVGILGGMMCIGGYFIYKRNLDEVIDLV